MNISHQEIYYSGDNSRTMVDARSDEALPIYAQIKEKFPWFKPDDCFAVSTPAFHEVLQETVISTCLGAPVTRALVGKNYVLSNRKFCLESGTSFLRVYPAWSDPYPDFLPEGCTPLFKGENLEELARPCPPLMRTFYDCYFRGDPATVEAHFSLPERRGVYDTFYGATIVNGEVGRVKQYVYDEQSRFSDWDVVWMVHNKFLQRELAGA